MQWVETDKNEHLRRKNGPYVEENLKSRLVNCGNYEDATGIRTDSPTCDVEGQRILMSWAASNQLPLRCADITNAYFQGHQLDRLILMRPPSGMPPGSVPEGGGLIARVPIYGTCDAGRGLWLRLREDLVKSGWTPSGVMQGLFYLRVNERIVGMLCTHVDDLLWACLPEGEPHAQRVLDSFDMGKIEKAPFRYCGKEVEQDSDGTIRVTCRNNTEKVEPIRIAAGRKPGDACTEGEISQLRSVVGSLAWIARECRPDIAYRTSRLQSRCAKAMIHDLRECNRVVDYLLETSGQGLTFTPNCINWAEPISVITITDASFANEEDIVEGRLAPHRSQRGRLHFLSNRQFADGGMEAPAHLIGFGSTLIKRVCRATLQAETYALQHGVEEGYRLRAILAEMHGNADHESFCAHLWLSDCQSLVQHLTSHVGTKVQDKRLSIEMEALRQSLESPHEILRWIDTSAMLADALTKAMKPDLLLGCLACCRINLTPAEWSVADKQKKQEQRRRTSDNPDNQERIHRPPPTPTQPGTKS